MKTRHIVVMVLATVATIYIGTGVITRSVGVAGRIGRLVEQANAESPHPSDELSKLIDDLAEHESADVAVDIKRDPMVPKGLEKKSASSQTAAAPAEPVLPSIVVTAVIIDENPVAVLSTGGRSITVEEGDPVNGGQVVEIRSDGVVIRYDDKTRTYQYPSGR